MKEKIQFKKIAKMIVTENWDYSHLSKQLWSVTVILAIFLIFFPSTWRYKTFYFPVLFPRTFSNRNVWNAKLLAFLVHDVVKHFIFPYFSNCNVWNTTLEISVSCFSSTWRYKTFHFPVLFQTATFEMQRYLLF